MGGQTVSIDPDKLKADTKLTRAQAAEALTRAGFPIAVGTLKHMVIKPGGPPYQIWGRNAIYTWGALLSWAKSRLRSKDV
jgi:hypothetical protein